MAYKTYLRTLTKMYFYVYIIIFGPKNFKNEAILFAWDPDRRLIHSQTAGSGKAGPDPQHW
jgi:hypothetical protein